MICFNLGDGSEYTSRKHHEEFPFWKTIFAITRTKQLEIEATVVIWKTTRAKLFINKANIKNS